MILKALYDYYHRNNNLPSYGCELKEIGFLLVLDLDGNFQRFEDRRIDKKSAQKFLVKKSVGRTSAPIANHLYDNSAYVFGISDKGDVESCNKYFAKFKEYIENVYNSNPDNSQIKSVYQFYQKELTTILETLRSDPLWDDISKNLNKKYSNFSFLIEGETQIIAEIKDLFPPTDELSPENEHICLITGCKSEVVDTTTATMITGSQATAKLVSFQVNSGYDSYGKKQGLNAPISREAEFAFTTALNHLLRADSRNKFIVGNRTFIFWASKNDEIGQQAEESIFGMFGLVDDKNDNPDNGIEQVRKTFTAIYSGILNTSLSDKFYILGLSPNIARIAVSYWAEIPLKEFAGMILRHFEDMGIIDTRKENKPYFGLRAILSAVTLGGKVSDVTPNLPEQVIKSIFQGISYPQTLFASCIRRIRTEQNLGITRAAIIKAYLNRLNINETKITPMLDKTNSNQGYLCGRLFAVLDKIQGDANNQHSIKERYMNAASASPASVFATILNLSSHHSEKLNDGKKIFYEKIKQEIIAKINADGFPSHLDLQDQGRFFVGYYHQSQDFFTKNEYETENNNNNK